MEWNGGVVKLKVWVGLVVNPGYGVLGYWGNAIVSTRLSHVIPPVLWEVVRRMHITLDSPENHARTLHGVGRLGSCG